MMKKKKIITYLCTLIGLITIGILCSIPQFYTVEMQVVAAMEAESFFKIAYENVNIDDVKLESTNLILEKSTKGYTGLAEEYKIKYSFVYNDWHCDITLRNETGFGGGDLLSVSDVGFYPKTD